MGTTPWGFRDILPDEAQAREDIVLSVKDCLKTNGYLPIETPLLEDRDALEEGGRISEMPFKLFDDDGRLLVVRHDNTLPIVRLVSSRMDAGDLPLRLRYEAPVVREQARFTGASRQFTQLGFELIGIGSAQGDAEIVSLAIEVMRSLGMDDWQVVCGSVRPYQQLLARCDRSLAADALVLVHDNDFVSLDARAWRSDEPHTVKEAICQLPRLFGGAEVLDRADALLTAAGIDNQTTTDELRALYASLKRGPIGEDIDERLFFDFSIMNSFDYYTGLVFKAYAGGLPDPVGSGGRYDAVFDGAFEKAPHIPAAGFAFSLERLEGALSPAGRSTAGMAATAAGGDYAAGRTTGAPLRIAIPKGSLYEDTLYVLKEVGLDVSTLRDPGRHLIFSGLDRNPTTDNIGEVEYIIVRPTDAPAFVAYGGADCGFCGRDSLIEADLRLLQLVDLGYGTCRFIEAEPAGREGAADAVYKRRGSLRVATKYPRIAKNWYDSRGISADIISLHGNIELGPIVGMADRIVDITATGTTLRENDMVITGDLMTCTARFFVNPGRARLDWRVRELGDRLQAYVMHTMPLGREDSLEKEGLA